jgi:hypothetical protein
MPIVRAGGVAVVVAEATELPQRYQRLAHSQLGIPVISVARQPARFVEPMFFSCDITGGACGLIS